MYYENDIITGVAELLAAEGVAQWDADGLYTEGGDVAAIYVQAVPDIARPIITLTPYPVAGGSSPNDSILGLQVRSRAEGIDPRPVNDLDGRVYAALHGRVGLSVGGHRVTSILFQSGAILGQDALDRWGRSANYYITGPRYRRG